MASRVATPASATAETGIGSLHALVERASESFRAGAAQKTSAPGADRAAEVLLADLLACVLGSPAEQAPAGWAKDGTTGLVAALAAGAHSADLDDVHRATVIHPGSIIWPVVLAVGAETGRSGTDVVAAARSGYQAMVELAAVLGPEHGRQWHATATCGALGAALASALLLDLGSRQRGWAVAHAVAMAGGVGQATLERSASTRFHRIAAATVGLQAARLAQAGVPASSQVLEGGKGVLALLAPGAERPPLVGPWRADAAYAMDRTSVRLFPINGFSQSVVALAAQLGKRVGPEVSSIVVEVSTSAAEATTGDPGGDWWDLATAVARAWCSGDPFRLFGSSGSDRLRPKVQIVPRGEFTWQSRVSAQSSTGSVGAFLEMPPGASLHEPGLGELLERKWDLIGGPGGSAAACSLAAAVLERGPRAVHLARVLSNRLPPAPDVGSPR